MPSVPPVIVDLVERFDRNRAAYRAGQYNEAQLRREFLDPFFEALGWDVTNKQGYAEAYKDVIHEDSIKVGGATKAPDYCFRIGGTRKFFLEAKKPSIDIRGDVSAAYQLRRYAWSAKLPLSILSDFEEFAVYDCRIRPEKGDSSAVARVLFYTYHDYLERWSEIAGIFAREAVLRGSFDRYAESTRAKRGTAEVDDAFLKEIESWRDLLARHLALRNPSLSQRELNYAVQATIDRIVFLRICEDRGIEQYGQLQALLNGTNVYARLQEVYRRADERYNSGLFHFHEEKGRPEPPDRLTPTLVVDDKPLKEILRRLYYPESPYEFSVLPADILGQVYEQFLGKVIRLTPAHRAVVEDKPEVKKAGGVYYTPTYIVDYIVKQTVGRLLEGKTPQQAASLRILDPACGSGSFLIGAYQYLLDWHQAWYAEHNPEKHARGRSPAIYQAPGGDWRLTTAERKRILLNNIYGVDIDPQAVGVTKLSLLLKVLEGESGQGARQLRLVEERALPDLGANIKCGNSLIAPDYYDGTQLSLFDQEQLYRINAFDWAVEFADIMEQGGFDAVIGNPPYVLLQDELRDDAQLSYFRSTYSTASYKIDTYHLFMHKAVQLAADNGFCAMITPANFITNNHLARLRRFLLEQAEVDHIVVIDGGVFQGISVDNAIFVVKAGRRTQGAFPIVHALPEGAALREVTRTEVSATAALASEYVLFTGSGDEASAALWRRVLDASVLLGAIANVNFGKQLRDRREHPDDVIELHSLADIPVRYRPCYTGRDILRYYLQWGGLACLDDDIARRGGCWDADKQNAKGQLLTRQVGRYPEFAMDLAGYQCLNTMFMVNLTVDDMDPHYVLGVLNSKLVRAFWLDRFYDQRRTFPKIKGTYLKRLPVPAVHSPGGMARHDLMVSLVKKIMALCELQATSKTSHDRAVLQRHIDTTDRQIDRLVYELYGLTEEEIRIVEGKTS
jgi:hypothetical protein